MGCVKLVHHSHTNQKHMSGIFNWMKHPKGSIGRSASVVHVDDDDKNFNPRPSDCFRALNVVIAVPASNLNFSHVSWKLSLERSIWLVFLDSSSGEYFQNSYLPFSLEMFTVNFQNDSYADLYDVYRVDAEKPIRAIHIGYWSEEKGLNVQYGTVYSRRKDLEGKVLRIGVIQNWPISYEITKSTGESEWRGLFPTIWQQISEVINVTSLHVRSVDSSTGSRKKDGTWTGLIGMAVRGEIDVIVSELTMNARRSEVLDFTRPLLKSRYQIYFKQPGLVMNWSGILRPFRANLWAAILLWVCVASIVLWIVYSICFNFGIERASVQSFGMLSFTFHIVQALSQQGRSDTPRSAACRILFFSSYLVSAVVIPSYSAALISSLTQKTPYRPFNSVREMLQDGTYRLLVADNTAERDYFADTNDELLSTAYRRLILTVPKAHEMKTIRSALTTVCKEHHYAIFGIEGIIAQRALLSPRPPCDILSMTQPLSTVHLSMALPKGHHLHPLINYHLTKMIEFGILSRITYESWPLQKDVRVDTWAELRVEEVFQMFCFLGFAIFVALVIFAVEKIIARRRQNAMVFYARRVFLH